MVGRVRELRELLGAFDDAAAGRGGVQLVIGDPGVGKTRLASALADHAGERDATVVWTRGWGRAAPPYWPWVEVVRRLCRDLEPTRLRAELGAGAEALLRLAPEIAQRLPASDQRGGRLDGRDDSEAARFMLFDALVALLRISSGQRPLVILIDDLQAVDEGSLVALDFVSRMLRDAAVLIVATMHEHAADRTPDAQAALQNIGRAGRRLMLGGLSPDDVGRLIEVYASAPPKPELARKVHAVTEGNAFFARETIALLVADGRLDDPPDELPLPEGVRETIRRRLEPLAGEAIEVLELAAICGRTFSLAVLERACAKDRDAVLAALDAAAALGLVVELPGRLGDYRFGHGLIGETLLARLPVAARMSGHCAVGAALEHVYRGAIDAHLPELADHFLSGSRGDVDVAIDYAARAAQRALDSLAYEQAAELFARALDALDRTDGDIARRAGLLLGLGNAQSRAGRSSSRATFEAAVAAARSIEADEILAQAALGFAPSALTPGYVDQQHVALLGEALDRIGTADHPLRVRLLGSLAVALYWSGSAQRRAELADEALAMARRLGDDDALAIALASAQLAISGPDSTRQGARWLRELFAITERTGESVMSLAARSRHADVLLELDDLAGADVAIETLLRLAVEARDRRSAAFGQMQRARRAALEGRFDVARELLDEVAEMAAELSTTTVPITFASQHVVLTWVQHGPRDVGERVRAYADGAPAMPCWRAALAASLACAGRSAEAQLEYDRLIADDCRALPRDSLLLGALALLTETAATLELPAATAQLDALLEPFADRNVVLPTAGFLGPVSLWRAILARVGGRPELALEHLVAARAAATRDGARSSLARISVEQAAALLQTDRADRRARAAALLDHAAAECEAMGMTALDEQVAQLRARLGGAPATRVEASVIASVGAPPAPRATTLRRTGDVWLLDDGERRLHLNDARGVRLLALLLQRPGVEVHSLDLVAAVDGIVVDGAAAARSDGHRPSTGFTMQGGSGPALDGRAKRDYRSRIAKLEAIIAGAGGDPTRVAQARAELEFITGELDRAVGLGGRDREAGSHAERARVNVTRAIRTTIKRVAGYDAALGAELDATVRTGTFCLYRPDPLRPRTWRIDGGA